MRSPASFFARRCLFSGHAAKIISGTGRSLVYWGSCLVHRVISSAASLHGAVPWINSLSRSHDLHTSGRTSSTGRVDSDWTARGACNGEALFLTRRHWSPLRIVHTIKLYWLKRKLHCVQLCTHVPSRFCFWNVLFTKESTVEESAASITAVAEIAIIGFVW